MKTVRLGAINQQPSLLITAVEAPDGRLPLGLPSAAPEVQTDFWKRPPSLPAVIIISACPLHGLGATGSSGAKSTCPSKE